MRYVKQMNNGRWYVLRTARSTELKLKCEDAGWSTKRAAIAAIKRELKTAVPPQGGTDNRWSFA